MNKTSIKIKKFWYADIADDGGIGTNWSEVQIGQREATVQFNGSDADVTNYKNILGSNLESDTKKGDKTMNFQLADLTAEVVAAFTGGTVTSDANSNAYYAPENENAVIEKSIKFLTGSNFLWIIPRASFDGYPVINDDDLHYYQMNSTVLAPSKAGVTVYQFHELLLPDENDITSFDILDTNGDTILSTAATITAGTHTVTAEVVSGSGLTALSPVIVANLGASIDPGSDSEQDFTTAVTYSVESANGDSQDWAITITEAV